MIYIVTPPSDLSKGKVALVLSFRGRIADKDVVAATGEDMSIWHMAIDEPGNDFLKFESQLSAFRI